MQEVSQNNIETAEMVTRVSTMDITDQTETLIGHNPRQSSIEQEVISYLNIIRKRGDVYDSCSRRNTTNPNTKYMDKFREHGNYFSRMRALEAFDQARNKNQVIEFLLGTGQYTSDATQPRDDRTDYRTKCGVTNSNVEVITVKITTCSS